LSCLIILEDLMESVVKHEKKLWIRPRDDITLPRPCDYFDLIGGTSTGSIIAILLARLRLGIRECIAIYSKLAVEIF
jgi:patatin-like phospholipase/acyl hydrolase